MEKALEKKAQEILTLLDGLTSSEAFSLLHYCERQINSVSIISVKEKM